MPTAKVKICSCCYRCESHCVCGQDCFDYGEASFEYMDNKLCEVCERERLDLIKNTRNAALEEAAKCVEMYDQLVADRPHESRFISDKIRELKEK